MQYYADKYRITTTGSYNMPVQAGDTLYIRYNPKEPTSFRVDTPYWLWMDIWSWYIPLCVVILMYYVVRYLVRRAGLLPSAGVER